MWSLSPITTLLGFRWFVIFIDDCTRMTWLYLLKHKDEVGIMFETFYVMVRTQYSTTIQVLHCDNGGKYVNHQLQTYFTQHGLIHETLCPQTPQQTSVIKQKNMNLL